MGPDNATFLGLLHSRIDRGALMSVIGFVNNAVKARMESIFPIAAALLVLFTAMLGPHLSAGIAGTLLVAFGVYEAVRKRKQERGHLNG